MSENEESDKPADSQIIVALRGKGGQSNDYKLLALTEEEIFDEIIKLSILNRKIFSRCAEIAEAEAKKLNPLPDTYSENVKLQITLAFFSVLSVSSFTALRSRLEKDLHER